MIIHIFSYANYLISNSEIVLFYDKSYNIVQLFSVFVAEYEKKV